MKERFVITAENLGFVAIDPVTRTASQGDTQEEAQANLLEAVELYLEEFPQTNGH